MSLHNCTECHEDAILIEGDDHFMARVRRTSFCKRYKRKRDERELCKSSITDSAQVAEDEWNSRFGRKE